MARSPHQAPILRSASPHWWCGSRARAFRCPVSDIRVVSEGFSVAVPAPTRLQNEWRISCQRQTTFAFLRALSRHGVAILNCLEMRRLLVYCRPTHPRTERRFLWRVTTPRVELHRATRRRREYASRSLPRGPLACALRRCAEHHARFVAVADCARVREERGRPQSTGLSSTSSMRETTSGFMNGKSGFWIGIWQPGLREFLQHFLVDIVKTLSILAWLAIFWGAIRLLTFLGYPQDNLQKLDLVHFVFTWLVLVVISIDFVVKLVVSLWKTQ